MAKKSSQPAKQSATPPGAHSEAAHREAAHREAAHREAAHSEQERRASAIAGSLQSDSAVQRPSNLGIEAKASFAEKLLFICAMSMLAAAILRAEPLQSANDRSRWATVWSLVERGTYQIDEIDQYRKFSTIDKVRHRTDESQPWHFYSSKPPLLSTMVAGLYAVERSTIGLGMFAHTHFVVRLLLLFVNLLPFMLAVSSLMSSLRLLRVSEPTILMMLAVAGFGSMLNPYMTTLNNHTPAAVCVLFSLSAMLRMEARKTSGSRQSRTNYVLLGFNAALASCFELPAALFGVLAFLFACKKDTARAMRWFVPAAIVPLAAFFVTNWICTGGVKPFYAYYGTEKYVYVHEGVPSYWSQPQDMDANNESWHVYLFHCILGHHGILSLSPILLLVLPAWRTAFRKPVKVGPGTSVDAWRWRVLNPVLRIGLVLTAVTLGFYLSRTQNYNYGGNSVALRWMLWLTPFWWFALIPIFEAIRNSKKLLPFALLLLAASIVSTNWSQDQPWKPSWLFNAMEQAGWIDYRTPRS